MYLYCLISWEHGVADSNFKSKFAYKDFGVLREEYIKVVNKNSRKTML